MMNAEEPLPQFWTLALFLLLELEGFTLRMVPGDRKSSNSGGAFGVLQSKNQIFYNFCSCNYIIKRSVCLFFFSLY